MRVRPVDLVDVLVYLIVLGVFIQFFPSVIAESFVLALLTAVLLKLMLEAVVWVKTALLRRIRTHRRGWVRVVNAIALLVLLPGSKFLVLEVVDLVFGSAVYLGGFVSVTVLIICLMLARAGVRRLVRDDTAPEPPARSRDTSTRAE